MRQSSLPFKTRREAPKDEVSKNAKLLIQAGYIHKEMAGVYSLLPLGLIVVEKIKKVIREEMLTLHASELSMSALQDKASWEKSGRWDDKAVDVWFKTALHNGTELGLGFTHEEPITAMLRDHISSYKDLPISVFQFQTKFRNELRAKSGIMRGREFMMKDLYSFCASEEEHAVFFNKAREAYIRIFKRLGLGEVTFEVFASGGSFAKYSLEFQTITDAGEDIVLVDREKGIGINKEIMSDEVLTEFGLDKDKLEEVKTAEVGNIFNLGTKFSEPLELVYKDEAGKRFPVVMGSYGIGIGRLMGVMVEIFSNDGSEEVDGRILEAGLVWPKGFAPFDTHIILASTESEEKVREAEAMYRKLVSEGKEVLFDDRAVSTKTKFADAKLIGIPEVIVIK